MLQLDAYIKDHEQWLMERILSYAKERGYTKYTSTLVEAWRASIQGMSEAVGRAVAEQGEALPQFSPEENFRDDPMAKFGVVEARKHRQRGISLPMFLGLFKYYRYSYVDLIRAMDMEPEKRLHYELFVERCFDRIEIAFCTEWAGMDRDKAILELQKSNRDMTNEKNKYLTLFESLHLPAILVDELGRVDNLNVPAGRMLGVKPIPGAAYYSTDRELKSLAESLPWLAESLDRLLQGGEQSFMTEVEPQGPDGPQCFTVILSRMQDYSGKFTGGVVILEDITEQRKLERLKEDVAKITRHDLKGPLSGVLSLLDILQNDHTLTAEQREVLSVAQKSGFTMLDMINRSLDLVKMEMGTYQYEPTAVDLCTVLRQLVAQSGSLLGAWSVQLSLRINGQEMVEVKSSPKVWAEDMLLYEALNNLLVNAIEASPKGAEVLVEVRAGEGGGQCCRIDITNQGAVPEDIRDRFFEKYATKGKKFGTGLGTYSSRFMIETMQGTVAMTTSDDATRVTVELPLAEGEGAARCDSPGQGA